MSCIRIEISFCCYYQPNISLLILDPLTFDAVISNDFVCDSISVNVSCSALVGSTGILNCDFDSDFSASLLITLPPESRATANATERIISVVDAQQEDSGVYICTAYYPMNTSVRSVRRITLKVQSKFMAINVQLYIA